MKQSQKQVNGRLDGLTILRFAHAYESGGGTEQYLTDLNNAIGKRNQMTIIQMQLTSDPNRLDETEELIGKSRLIKIPLLVRHKQNVISKNIKSRVASIFKTHYPFALDRLLFRTSLNHFAMKKFMLWRKVPERSGHPEGAGAKAAEILQRYRVDLVILHTGGGADASEIIDVAKSAHIPVALVYHYSNDRLGGISLRQQICRIDGVAGVSGVGLPAYLRNSFCNLSDAVDVDFFKREKARPLPKKISGPVLYAPGRVIPEKGQADVIEVASILKHKGLSAKVIFAGRLDDKDFKTQLMHLASQKNLSDSVEFLGLLSPEDYRDWYCAATVMVMPTYHHEGLGRILIESQGMKVPPLVYDIGGTSEGIRDKETGVLIRIGDIEGMTKAVEMLINNPELHKNMANAGRKFVEKNFSMVAFAERHENFYCDVLEKAAHRGVT